MEELDLLKKNWQKDTHLSNQFSENDIYGMLHKKSSSIVKWIFIISLIEFGIGFLLSFLMSFTKTNEENMALLKKMGIYEINFVTSIFLYAVVFYFIIRFYKMYRNISTDKNTKDLIDSILKTRKVVKQYIGFNLSAIAFIIIVFGSYSFSVGYEMLANKNGDLNPDIPIHLMLIGILVMTLIAAIITLIGWYIYKLLYGILLKRLNKNYEELKKLDF